MTDEDYYIAPDNRIFQDIKETAIEIWNTYDNTYGYVTEKVSRIEHITNVKDNTCHIVSMFDSANQNRLLKMVKLEESKIWLRKLMVYSMKYYGDLLNG